MRTRDDGEVHAYVPVGAHGDAWVVEVGVRQEGDVEWAASWAGGDQASLFLIDLA